MKFNIWKVHVPLIEREVLANGDTHRITSDALISERTNTAEKYNVAIWDDCKVVNHDGMVERGAEIRSVEAYTDRLPGLWEAHWQLMYLWQGRFYFAEPDAVLYPVRALSECDDKVVCP